MGLREATWPHDVSQTHFGMGCIAKPTNFHGHEIQLQFFNPDRMEQYNNYATGRVSPLHSAPV